MISQSPQKSLEQSPRICLALHNIRSTHNVGSIFRTADAVGVSKIYLCGYTPVPTDRFGRLRKDIAKVSLGAEKTVEWESVKDIKKLIEDFKKKNFKIYAVEQSENSIDYRDIEIASNCLFIFGNEVGGIEKEILEKCDKILEIPMMGKKESLNVAVAVGVALFGRRGYDKHGKRSG